MFEPSVKTFLLCAVVGLTLAAALAASPLTVCVLAAMPILARLAGRGLPLDERRWLLGILGAAFAARALLIAAQAIAGIPHLNDMSIGALSGDESYYLSRALRSRDLLLGFTGSKYDFFVANDEYGRTSYLTLLTWLQVVFGPTPYGMKLVNAAFFLGSATLLYRLARSAFGMVPALIGLTVLVTLPSLFVSSVSLLKESLYALVASTVLVCAWRLIESARAHRWQAAWWLGVIGGTGLWLLNDLRRGAMALMLAGLGLALALRVVAQSRRRAAGALALLVLGAGVGLSNTGWRAQAIDRIESAAKLHAGHVFTVGHAYKLMDEGFYASPQAPMAWDLTLTEPQAARFLLRATVSFLVTPLPWEMRSWSELAFLPEHVLWYTLLALLPAGIAAGWRRQPMATALLIGVALPTAAALALTTGNVGTLLRLRGLVTPYLVWLGALGLCVVVEWLAHHRPRAAEPAPFSLREGTAL